jgi:hypothetical protein
MIGGVTIVVSRAARRRAAATAADDAPLVPGSIEGATG